MAKNNSAPDIEWLTAPEPHNYPAALSYLSLLFERLPYLTSVEDYEALLPFSRSSS